MTMDYDRVAAQKKYRSFKSRLTRLKNRKDYKGIIDLWNEFKAYYNNSNEPWPDAWSNWQRAADDAAFAIRSDFFSGKDVINESKRIIEFGHSPIKESKR